MSRGSQDARLTPQVRRSHAAKILVIDDEPKLVQNVKTYLEDASYRVVTAADGHEALEVFEREQPDLIILDLRLPKLHGMEVARAAQPSGRSEGRPPGSSGRAVPADEGRDRLAPG